MDNTRRLEVYKAQRNGGRVTSRQARRLMKNVTRIILRNPAQAQAEIAEAAATVVELPAVNPSATVTNGPFENYCKTCGAVGNEPCVTASGKPAKSTHKARTLPVAA